jgi:HPt (histidine-containing phosphotransfer) domain-containing protein
MTAAASPTPIPINAGRPPIEGEAFFSRCMGSFSLAEAYLDDLETHLPRWVDELLLQAGRGQTDDAADVAHSVKGAAAILGAEALREMAAKVEASGRAGDAPRLAGLAQELSHEADRCRAYAPALRAEARRRLTSQP